MPERTGAYVAVVDPAEDARKLAEQARAPIREVARMEADYSTESLAAVDHYLEQLGAKKPENVAELAGRVGCYFGEVLRKKLGARWEGSPSEEPRTWRLLFDAAPLSVSPVGMAAEAIYQEEVGEFDGSLVVPSAFAGGLEQALDAMAEVTEEYYYSLTGRLETIEHVISVLVALSRKTTTKH